jgi:histidine triad (HIT) family protein
MSQASTNPDCLFCKIVAGTIPAKRLHEDDQSIAFADINPQAPTHLLIIPKQHLTSLAHVAKEDAPLLGHLTAVATDLARTTGLANGYRLVVNTGDDGGQTVHHLHLHLLGGRPMHWPPG